MPIVDALGVDVSIRGRPRPRREEPLARRVWTLREMWRGTVKWAWLWWSVGWRTK